MVTCRSEQLITKLEPFLTSIVCLGIEYLIQVLGVQIYYELSI